MIGSVMPGEPADKAGMKDGDIIIEVNGKSVEDANALLRAIAMQAPGSKVDLVVWRDNAKKELTVRLGERNVGKQTEDIRNQKDAPSALGIAVRPLTAEESRAANLKRGTGLLVVGVESGKAASEADIREGDVILTANLKPVNSADALAKIIREEAKKRGAVTLQLQRQGPEVLPRRPPYGRRQITSGG